MKLNLKDPVCALITPLGTGAIHVVRISGAGAIEIVARHFQPSAKLINSPGHNIVHGIFQQNDGNPLDEVLCSVFKAPTSYTGDDTVEISCHGNPRIATGILEVLLGDARMANPGEFTLRAMHNNKIDLIQAEAVKDLIEAPTARSGSAALSQVRGYLSVRLKDLLERITHARIRCEMAIDFADQDLPQIDLEALTGDISELLSEIQALWEEGRHGIYIRDGIRICLAGAPNSGKSSLFNAFLKHNRAIVTPHPGTTRDYLEESFSLKGYSVILYDTAGLRDTLDEIEQEGIDRSHDLMREADLLLYLKDASQPWMDEDLAPEIREKTLFVISKADLVSPTLLDGLKDANTVAASVVNQDGLQELTNAILARFAIAEPLPERPLVTNSRHLAALKACGESLEKALAALKAGLGFEFAAFDLIAASGALEEILGIITPDDLLQRIFADFCVGK